METGRGKWRERKREREVGIEVKKIESGLRMEAVLTSRQKMISADMLQGRIRYGNEYSPSTPTALIYVDRDSLKKW